MRSTFLLQASLNFDSLSHRPSLVGRVLVDLSAARYRHFGGRCLYRNFAQIFFSTMIFFVTSVRRVQKQRFPTFQPADLTFALYTRALNQLFRFPARSCLIFSTYAHGRAAINKRRSTDYAMTACT